MKKNLENSSKEIFPESSKLLLKTKPLKLLPVILKFLGQFLRFKDYDIMVNLHQSDNTCIYTLFNKENTLVEKDNQLEITDLAWNSTGLTLAAS